MPGRTRGGLALSMKPSLPQVADFLVMLLCDIQDVALRVFILDGSRRVVVQVTADGDDLVFFSLPKAGEDVLFHPRPTCIYRYAFVLLYVAFVPKPTLPAP